jgi:hypothetical protein
MYRTAFVAFALLFISCRGNDTSPAALVQASLDAMGTREARNEVKNITALANCVSQRGTYQTEVRTALNGYTYFKQTFSDSTRYEASIHGKIKGVRAGSAAPLPPEVVFAIRSHEFHGILFQLNERIHDFAFLNVPDTLSPGLVGLQGKDELDHVCFVFFDANTRLIREIHFEDPMDEKTSIKVSFSNWKKTGKLQLPYFVSINQGGKLFTFDFVQISLNDPAFREITLR